MSTYEQARRRMQDRYDDREIGHIRALAIGMAITAKEKIAGLIPGTEAHRAKLVRELGVVNERIVAIEQRTIRGEITKERSEKLLQRRHEEKDALEVQLGMRAKNSKTHRELKEAEYDGVDV